MDKPILMYDSQLSFVFDYCVILCLRMHTVSFGHVALYNLALGYILH